MFRIWLRPAMIFIPLLLGFLLPQAHILNDPPWSLIRRALMLMIFFSSLKIRWNELLPRREHWLVLAANLLMGIVPWLLCRLLLPGEPDLAAAAFFTGIAPTATAAPVVVSFLHGRTGFALTGFVISDAGISLALLFLLPLLTHEFSLAFFFSVCRTLGEVILLPLLAAMLFRKFHPAAEMWPKKMKNFTFSLWSLTLFLMASIARNDFLHRPEDFRRILLPAAVISLLICAANFYLGARLARKKYRRESSQILGQKNTSFTLFLALLYAGPSAALGPIFYVIWHNSWNAVQLWRHEKRRGNLLRRRGGKREPSPKAKGIGGMRTLFFLFLFCFSAPLWGEEIFYVPGWRTGFDRREHSVRILRENYPGMPVTVKSWNSAVPYHEAEKNAEIYAETLKRELFAMPEARRSKLILVGHSLGARIVVNVLDALAGQGIRIREAVLLGAAVNWDDPRIAHALNALERRCWNIYSPHDLLLAFYPLTKGTKALGQTGWSYRDRRFLERKMTSTRQHFAYLYLTELGLMLRAAPPWEKPLQVAPCALRRVLPSLDQGLYWEKSDECGSWLLLIHKTGGEERIVDPDGMIRAEGKKEAVETEFQKIRAHFSAGTK